MDTRIVKSWVRARICGLVVIDVGLLTGGPGFEPGWGPFFPKIPWGHLLAYISFRGVSPVYFPLVNFIPWRVSDFC